MKTIAKILPHISIILSIMMLVFYFIDRVNSAMEFINNDITKTLLCIMSFVTIAVSYMLIYKQRRS